MGIKAGALSIDHLQKISDAAIVELSNSSTVATLLPATSFFLGLPYAPARKLLDAGAQVALATDYNPGTAPDTSLLFTAKLAASQMKMSPVEIFSALSYNAAQSLQETSMGVIDKNYSNEILFWNCSSSDYCEEILIGSIFPQDLSK
jgi:imidazolonepropionase